MAKRVFLVHGWKGHPDRGWRPWLRKELETRGFSVSTPAMPDTNHPKMGAWLRHLQKIVETSDEDCYFVGHSLGCIAILRYLETLQEWQKAGGTVLVAGFSDNLGFNELDSFFAEPIPWDKIKAHCKKFVAIHSDNDFWVPFEHGPIFKEKLGTELILQPNMKHFSGDEGTTELPIVLESIIKMANAPPI